MISIIICSRHSDIPQNLKENIQNTIAVEYELIVIDNSSNKHSIFSAYNEGVRRSKYPYLCFAHEDILFRTENWGCNIIKHFEDSTIGLIGMAGANFLPNVPVYWSPSPFISEYNLHNDNRKIIECYHTAFFKDDSIVDAVACDGFCLFIRKELFKIIAFDDKTYEGFHFYDMDICMQVISNNYRVCICRDVLIEHFWSESASRTKVGIELFNVNRNLFFDKWETYFPISRGVDLIPPLVLERVNRLYVAAYDAEKVRNSQAYKLGKFLLLPVKRLVKIFK